MFKKLMTGTAVLALATGLLGFSTTPTSASSASVKIHQVTAKKAPYKGKTIIKAPRVSRSGAGLRVAAVRMTIRNSKGKVVARNVKSDRVAAGKYTVTTRVDYLAPVTTYVPPTTAPVQALDVSPEQGATTSATPTGTYVTTQQAKVATRTQVVRVEQSGPSAWDRLAKCEAGGNWSINTGNGYYGGLQFTLGSWRAVGGKGYPHHASREEQIKRGTMLKNRGGWGNWPGCSRKLGLR